MKSDLAAAAGIGTSSIQLAVLSGSVIVLATMPADAAKVVSDKIRAKQLKALDGSSVVSAALFTSPSPAASASDSNSTGKPPSPLPLVLVAL